jgi:hypothetical protein
MFWKTPEEDSRDSDRTIPVWRSVECGTLSLSMNAQNAAAQLLYEIVGRVIPQSAKKQGIPHERHCRNAVAFACLQGFRSLNTALRYRSLNIQN